MTLFVDRRYPEKRGGFGWIRFFAVLAVVWGTWAATGPKADVAIPQGRTTGEIARILKKEGVIRSTYAFRGIAKLVRFDKNIQAGLYHLNRRMGSAWAIWRLTHSKPDLIVVVIPEGFSARQIAERLEAKGVCPAEAFRSYVEQNKLEGLLFPATYQFMPTLPPDKVALKMHQEFVRNVDPEFSKHTVGRLSEKSQIILASIVQREAVLREEGPMIAAVYLNRMIHRMRLEADPTVQYALGYWKKGLTLDDLKVQSPYNTYLHFGLPPAPICSPGLDAIRAVLGPAKTDALYFVADHTGGHAFSKTFEEHLRAKAQAKRNRRPSKR